VLYITVSESSTHVYRLWKCFRCLASQLRKLEPQLFDQPGKRGPMGAAHRLVLSHNEAPSVFVQVIIGNVLFINRKCDTRRAYCFATIPTLRGAPSDKIRLIKRVVAGDLARTAIVDPSGRVFPASCLWVPLEELCNVSIQPSISFSHSVSQPREQEKAPSSGHTGAGTVMIILTRPK
jgi:hypothetical protein